jgi:hypothetical protein
MSNVEIITNFFLLSLYLSQLVSELFSSCFIMLSHLLESWQRCDTAPSCDIVSEIQWTIVGRISEIRRPPTLLAKKVVPSYPFKNYPIHFCTVCNPKVPKNARTGSFFFSLAEKSGTRFLSPRKGRSPDPFVPP